MKDFEPHYMYDPKTGKRYWAKTHSDHVRMNKMGYTHKQGETYSPQKHEWGTDASNRFARKMTPGQQKENSEKPMKTFSQVYEAVNSADKKPQTYKNPVTGKTKTRMVPVDNQIVDEGIADFLRKVKTATGATFNLSQALQAANKGDLQAVKTYIDKAVKRFPPEKRDEVSKKLGKLIADKSKNKAMGKIIGTMYEEVELDEQSSLFGINSFKNDSEQEKVLNKLRSVNKTLNKGGYKTNSVAMKSALSGKSIASIIGGDSGSKYTKKGSPDIIVKFGFSSPGNSYVRVMKEGVEQVDEAYPFYDMSDTGGPEEVRMALRQLNFIADAADEISEYIEERGDMDEWFQNKLTVAHYKMKTLYAYVEGEEDEELEESRRRGSQTPEQMKAHIAKLQKRLAKVQKNPHTSVSADPEKIRVQIANLKHKLKLKQTLESVEGTRVLSEPATSKAQQQAAGAALAAKRGDIDPSKLKGASRDMYKSMSKKELEDFASTKHKGLPTRKESNDLGVLIPMEYDEDNNLIPKQEGSALWDIRKKTSKDED